MSTRRSTTRAYRSCRKISVRQRPGLNNLASRYDAGNPAIAAAQDEIDRLKSEMQKEFGRIQAVYRSNLEVAQTREQLLNDELASLTETGTDKNLARVELSEMESRATTYRRMYESILQQLIGALQKESFPLGNARIVTAAAVPLAKTWPKSSIVIPFSAMLGLAAGLGLHSSATGWIGASARARSCGVSLVSPRSVMRPSMPARPSCRAMLWRVARPGDEPCRRSDPCSTRPTRNFPKPCAG